MTQAPSPDPSQSAQTHESSPPPSDSSLQTPRAMEDPLITQPDSPTSSIHTPRPTTPSHQSSPQSSQSSPPSSPSSATSSKLSVNINNVNIMLQDEEMYMNTDSINVKNPNDFRIVLQNPNGIKIYQDKDPEYLPSMETLKDHKAGAVCLPETNVPWHKHDLFYDISVQNQVTWKHLPTKTVVSSCRSETKTKKNYQPGGVMTVIANTMTTKIKTTTSDSMGRWTKELFHAK